MITLCFRLFARAALLGARLERTEAGLRKTRAILLPTLVSVQVATQGQSS